MKISRYVLTIVLLPILAAACAPRPRVPIETLEYRLSEGAPRQNLLILLRGRGGSYKDFEKHGIIAEVRERDLPFDIIVPDSHFGYYRSETLPERLKHDVIDPARAKGYRRVWLAGFSMGGLGSLFFLKAYGDDVDGVILVSPFMGWSWNSILDEIEGDGGVGSWTDPYPDKKSWQRRIWRWVKEYNESKGDYPPIFIGYGTDDLMTGNGPRLLAEAVGPENSFSVPGGHDYGTFKDIWKRHLDRLDEKKTEPF